MTTIYSIPSLTIFLPLFAAIAASFLGFLIGHRGASLVTCVSIGFSALISWLSFYFFSYMTETTIYIKLLNWIFLDKVLTIDWELLFDSLTITMLVVVNTISFLVHIYSIGYMAEDPHRPRFMSYLSLFTFFMIMLVTASNFMQILIGWEGVGLSSYLLINFWYTRVQANKAAIKAMLVNKVGDIALILAIICIYFICRTFSFDSVFLLLPEYSNNLVNLVFFQIKTIDVVCLLLLIAAIGKSAQLGLHTWLPDAMEGPTPVSALIHAATMVTAGIFLIIRCSFLFEYSQNILNIVALVGAFTAFFGAITGLFLFDIKKIIAYSTCSQLGYMLYSCGLSNYTAGIYHLTNHAFFKALLFLTAGSIIHGLNNEQDIRRSGSIANSMPLTFLAFLIGSLALIGAPYLAGFYSKDLILETSKEINGVMGSLVYFWGLTAAFFTAFYSMRLIYLVFLAPPCTYKGIQNKIHESSIWLVFPLIVLSICSVFSGFFLEEIFLSSSSEFFKNSICILPKNYILIDIEYIDVFIKVLPSLLTSASILIAIIMYHHNYQNILHYKINRQKISNITHRIFEFFNQKWFFDKNYNTAINNVILNNIVEKVLFNGYTSFWESWYSIGPGYFTKKLISTSMYFTTSGFISHYVAISLSTIILILIIIAIVFFNEKTLFPLTSELFVAQLSIFSFNHNMP